MNTYRFEISNRRESKFCLHGVSLRLHLKTTQYFDEHALAFHFGYCLHEILSPEIKTHFCQNDRSKIAPTMTFKRTCSLSAIFSESALISFALGKFCSHENLRFKISFRSKFHTGLGFISSQFMWKQVKSWLKTEVRFLTETKSHTGLNSFFL